MNTDENNGAIGATAIGLKADASATTRVAISPPGLEAREGKNTEAELRQLQLLVEQLRGNEIEIQRRNDLLEGLIEYCRLASAYRMNRVSSLSSTVPLAFRDRPKSSIRQTI